jgi:hypothetical protein
VTIKRPQPEEASATGLGKIVGKRIIRLRRLASLGALPCFYLLMPSATRAAELDLTGGIEQTTPNTGRTYTGAMECRQSFAEHFAASFIWLNEGHLIDNHRDGQGIQVWWRTRPIGPGLVLELGVGPYHYCDTTSAVDIVTATGSEIGYQNGHGWAVLSYGLSGIG